MYLRERARLSWAHQRCLTLPSIPSRTRYLGFRGCGDAYSTAISKALIGFWRRNHLDIWQILRLLACFSSSEVRLINRNRRVVTLRMFLSASSGGLYPRVSILLKVAQVFPRGFAPLVCLGCQKIAKKSVFGFTLSHLYVSVFLF